MRTLHKSSSLLIAPAALLVAAACSEGTGETGGSLTAGSADAAVEEESDEGEEDSSRTIPMTETGWLTVGSDGSVLTTFFDSGGRYRDFRNGEPLGEGRWEQRPDGSVCFDPDSGAGECWETDSPEDDGSMIVTNEDDKRIGVRRVTYTAPQTDEEASDETG